MLTDTFYKATASACYNKESQCLKQMHRYGITN